MELRLGDNLIRTIAGIDGVGSCLLAVQSGAVRATEGMLNRPSRANATSYAIADLGVPGKNSGEERSDSNERAHGDWIDKVFL